MNIEYGISVASCQRPGLEACAKNSPVPHVLWAIPLNENCIVKYYCCSALPVWLSQLVSLSAPFLATPSSICMLSMTRACPFPKESSILETIQSCWPCSMRISNGVIEAVDLDIGPDWRLRLTLRMVHWTLHCHWTWFQSFGGFLKWGYPQIILILIILMGFSIINHQFLGTPIYGTPIYGALKLTF